MQDFQNNRGLTIVEALVTLVILSFGLIPAISILSSSTKLSSLIENNLIAAHLAEEGVEIIRSLRDENWLNSISHSNGLVGNWRVEWNTNSTTNLPVAVGTNPTLNFDTSTGVYTYSNCGSCIGTGFKRSVTVVQTNNSCNCELVVVSRVEWPQHGTIKIQNVESHLFDWQ